MRQSPGTSLSRTQLVPRSRPTASRSAQPQYFCAQHEHPLPMRQVFRGRISDACQRGLASTFARGRLRWTPAPPCQNHETLLKTVAMRQVGTCSTCHQQCSRSSTMWDSSGQSGARNRQIPHPPPHARAGALRAKHTTTYPGALQFSRGCGAPALCLCTAVVSVT